MAEAQKDTIYVDIDDEITTIIDKVRASEHKIVALVLPKRAGVFQSLVNMKLLKRTADAAKKRIVLITSEGSLLPLAGAVGLYVAKTLQTKPAIPPAPEVPDAVETVSAESEAVSPSEIEDAAETPVDKTKSVGELAGTGAATPLAAEAEETIELDNTDESEAPAKPEKAKAGKGSINKKLKVPNFNKFRLKLFLAIGLVVLLIVGWILANVVLPKAKITIQTETSRISLTQNFTADTTVTKLDKDNGLVPAKQQQLNKNENEKVPATGKTDKGNKASGTIRVTNCSSDTVSIPGGTGYSTGQFTFIGNQTINVPKSSYSFTPSGFVCNKDGYKDVTVTAQNAGESYNVSERDFQIANAPTNVSARGGPMSGGTTNIVKVVSAADIASAKDKLTSRANTAAKDELKKNLQAAGYIALTDTFNAGNASYSNTPNVDDEASDVTVTASTTYTMLGIKQDDLKALVKDAVNEQIDPKRQSILDDGIASASYQVTDPGDPKKIKMSVQLTGQAGAQINVDEVKRLAAGQKKGDIRTALKDHPSITEVTVTYSPFWVSKAPKKLSKITVVIEKTQNNAKKQ